MSKTKERRCKFCKKILLSYEKILCHRCILSARDIAISAGLIGGGAAATSFGVKSLLDDHFEKKRIDNYRKVEDKEED